VLPQAAQGYQKDRDRIASTAQALRPPGVYGKSRTLSGGLCRVAEHIRRSFDLARAVWRRAEVSMISVSTHRSIR
jgi:hypothetical protein